MIKIFLAIAAMILGGIWGWTMAVTVDNLGLAILLSIAGGMLIGMFCGMVASYLED